MPRVAKELGPLAVSRLTTPGLHSVGGVAGLALQVLPPRPDPANPGKEIPGARTWVLRVMVAGKRRDMGLGSFGSVPLADARRKARDAREAIDKGLDPIEDRRRAKVALLANAGRLLTFEQAAKDFVKARESGWKSHKSAAAFRQTIEDFANPVIGKLAVGDIETRHVLEILRPLWGQKVHMGKALARRIEQVLDACKAEGAIRDPWSNPSRWRGRLDKILPRPAKVAPTTHRPALAIDAVPDFVARLRKLEGHGARALELLVLTGVRSAEARGAVWTEFDIDARVWVIPGARTKSGKALRVPLAEAAVQLLEAQPRLADCPYVFPSARRGQLTDLGLSRVCRALDAIAVVHGFRSCLRDWGSERAGFPREVCEAALGHTLGSVEASYARSDLFERRTRMMDAWATFCDTPIPAPSSKVTPMRRARG